jgi:hypothetical protein
MPFNDTPTRLEAVFVQRDDLNRYYEQINISGSNLIVYLNEEGKIDVDKIPAFLDKYFPGTGFAGSASWASSSLSSSYAETASYVPFNGDRPITRQDSEWQGINVGGEHVVEFLDNFFFPFNAATVSITNPSSTIYYETGSVQTRTITSTITPNSETLFGTGSVKKDGLAWNTIAVIPPYTPAFTNTNFSSSHTYQTFIQTNNNGAPLVISSNIRSILFIYPYLWGLNSTPGLEGTTLYTTMQSKSITTENDKSGYFWGTGTYIYFTYPSSYASLISILDPNNFELLPSFEYSASVPVTSSGLTYNWMRTYKVYRLKLLASPQGLFQFLN